MPTVNALLTNFNGPNYHGLVHQTTPSDTPFTTALMGTAVGGGEAVINSRTFEWQTFDLRAAGQNTVVDGDSAGTGEHRSRQNVFNVLQTHREDIDVAYERLAQIGQFDGQNISGGNPVSDEEAWQLTQMWKQIKRDIEFSLINGSYVLPADNNTAAQTRGILEAITTNVEDASEEVATLATSAAADDIFDTDAAHGLAVGDDFYLTDLSGGAGLSEDTRYYVTSVPTSTSFTASATKGGASLDWTTDITDGNVVKYGEPDEESVGDLMQSAYDNGGLQESSMGLLIVNSGLKRWLTKIFVKDKNIETRTRNIGGANVQVVETDFGQLGIMLNRYIPQGTLAAVSLDQCKPHFRFVPGKGVMFSEPLGKDGASNKTQLYASVGLEYGFEAAHAKNEFFTANAPAAE
ncbi:MAG TPA: DUF5309 family protein [Acidimicrobiia bacterium]